MIMQGTTQRALTWSGLLALFGLGAFLLPVMPTWAQEEQGQPLRVVVADDKADGAQQAEVAKLRAMLEQKRAELQKLEAQIRAAQSRAEKQGAGAGAGAGAGEKKEGRIIIEIIDGDKKQTYTLPGGSSRILDLKGKIDAETLDKLKKGMAGQGDIAAQVKRATEEAAKAHARAAEQAAKAAEQAARVRVKVAEEVARARKAADEAKARGQQGKGDDKAKATGHRLVIEIVSDGKRQVIELPPGSRVLTGGEAKAGAHRMGVTVIRDGELKLVPVKPGEVKVAPVKPGEKGPPTGAGQLQLHLKAGQGDAAERRLENLEKRLEELMRSVKELRGEMQKKPAPGKKPRGDDDEAVELRLDVKALDLLRSGK